MDKSAYRTYYKLEKSHFWRIAKRELIIDHVAQLLSAKAKNTRCRILDIGGSCSLISRRLSRFGVVVSIEPDKETVSFARKNLKVDCRVGDLPNNLPEFTNQFELITLFDVLEHVEEEHESLQTIHGLLSDDGNLVLTVPAYQWLWSDHDVALHHKRRYTTKRLRTALEKAGFEIQTMTYYTTLLFPIAAVVRLLNKIKPKPYDHQPEYKVKVPNPIINFLFGCVMKFEKILLKFMNMPFGLSIICVCKKK